MKSIMISIKPQWVAKILNGDKTIEIRKTAPKCELPCRVYIYCTKEKSYLDRLVQNHNGFYYTVRDLVDFDADDYGLYYDVAGKNGEVVAEFTLNEVETIEKNQVYNASVVRHNACLNIMQLHDYIKGKGFHAWHIDDLKIYDEPRELSEFKRYCNLVHGKENTQCFKLFCKNKDICNEELLTITKPPQSWCYVEECSDVKD